jgi:hypothetical protein
MSVTIAMTEAQMFTVLRSFLLGIVPTTTPAVEVLRAQQNRVAPPQGPNYVIMTPLLSKRLSTTRDTYLDGGVVGGVTQPGYRYSQYNAEITIQVDCYGPLSGDLSKTVATLWRSEYTCDIFSASGYAIAPLYEKDPRQVQFVDGQQQYEYRWSVDLVLQANLVVTTPQQFADVIVVSPVEVEGTYGLVDVP